jgi:hypothetical protein
MSNRRRLRAPRARWAAADHEPSAWLRGRLHQLDARHRAGPIELCPHLTRGGRESGATALWQPDLIVCTRPGCLSRLRLYGAADRTCDRCGRVVSPIHPDSVLVPPRLAVAFGLCCGCQRAEVGGPCGDEQPTATGSHHLT